MTKLSDTQLILLNTAAQRDDLGVAAIDKRAATREAIEALLKAKLLKTAARTGDLALWAREDNQQLGLIVTPKGLKAINMDGPDVVVPPEAPPARPKSAPKIKAKSAAKAEPKARTGTKLGVLVKLMQRPKGASLADLMAATGWQAHSVRGAISGAIKKKLGLAVLSEVTGDTRTYRIVA